MDDIEALGLMRLNQMTTTTTMTTMEGLRQRQLDRRAPRSGPAKTTTTTREAGENGKAGVRVGAPPRTKVMPMATGNMAGEGASGIKQSNETSGPGDREMPTMHSRAKAASGEGEGTAAKEGRQFTVGKVGNNGRIYLRYVWLPRESLRGVGDVARRLCNVETRGMRGLGT
jgi:hypothetical protein